MVTLKKYLFLLIVPIFLLFPRDVFAATLQTDITLFDDDYNVVASCKDCTEIYNIKNGQFVPYENVNKIRFSYNNTGLFTNLKYKFDTKFMVNYTNTPPPPTGTGLCYNGSCPDVSYEWKRLDYSENVPYEGASLVTYGYSANWTQSSNADGFFFEMYFSDYSLRNVILGASLESSLVTTGDSTGDIIAGTGQNIISNQNANQQQTNEKLDKIEDSLTSEESPDLDSLNNSAGWLPVGPVDSILNLPLSFFNNLTDNLSKSCQPVAFTFPFTNTNFSLPCISTLYDQIGIQDFLNWSGLIVGCIILYYYFLNLYKWVDDTLTFRENNHADWGGV